MGKSRTDKEAVRTEYISTDISLRALAKKHNIAQSTIFKWSREGEWNLDKQKFLESAAHLAQLDLNARKEHILKNLTDRWIKTYETADRILEKVNELLDLRGDVLAPRDLKSLSSIIVDIMTLHSYSEKREREDKAKEADGEGNSLDIEFALPEEDWEE